MYKNGHPLICSDKCAELLVVCVTDDFKKNGDILKCASGPTDNFIHVAVSWEN